MANDTQIGNLVIDLKMRLDGLEKGLKTAQDKLKRIEEENKKVEASNEKVEASYIALSAVAVASLVKINGIIKEAVEEYKSYTQAMSSLQNVSEYTGQSMDDFAGIMEKFGAYMTRSDIATTIKNFSLMGMTAKQTEQMIEALTNSAIRNRNANYTVSEAVRVASEGYRQGLSTLSDSAGVTENLSVMQENYAKSIGKTASQLTEEEKNLAYLNRTMQAAEPFAGAMGDYLDSLAGKQGQYSQAMRETQVAFTESMEPMLIRFEELKTKLVSTLGDYIEKNKAGTAGIVSFGVAMLSVVATIKVAQTAMSVLNTTMLASPVTWIAAALGTLVGVVTTVSTALEEQKNKQEELRLEQEEYNAVLHDTIKLEDERIQKINASAQSMNEYFEKLNERRELLELMSTVHDALVSGKPNNNSTKEEIEQYQALEKMQKQLGAETRVLSEQLAEQSEAFKQKFGIEKQGLLVEEDLEDIQKAYNKQVEKGKAIQNIKNAMDISTIKNEQKQAAQLRVNVEESQRLLNVYKNSTEGTEDYNSSLQALMKLYPECVTAEGLVIESAQAFINAENDKANEPWASSQSIINNYAQQIEMALQDEEIQRQICENLGEEWDTLRGKLENVLSVLSALAGASPNNVQGITIPSTSPARSSGSSYSGGASIYKNTELDDYKKMLEYKKSLDQLSIRDEIAGYEYALNRFAETEDERQELITKIYSLRKELQQKELDDYTNFIDYKKSLDQISIQDEINMYQYAYNELAKTTEQKRDIEVKLYELRKELKEKEEEDQQALLDKHIEYIQYKKSLDQLSAKEEIEAYQYAYDNLAKTEEQKRDLEVTLYSLRKELQENELSEYISDLNYRKSLDQVSLKEEIKSYEYALKNLAKTIEQKKDIEKTLYDLKKQLREEELQAEEKEKQKQAEILDSYIDTIRHKKTMDQISLTEEIKMYEYAYDVYAKTNEQKQDLEETLYKLRKQLQQDVLAEYKSELNYRKSLDKLSLKEEIEKYEYALENLAETTEQKKDIEKTLYDLRKELANQTANALKAEADAERESLSKRTKEYEKYMETKRKSKGAAYDVKEETADLDKLVKLHKDYLEQVLKDERYSLEERKKIYEEELEIVKTYEDKKRSLRVSSIDNTVTQLKDAITKQLEEMQKADKEAIQNNIKLVEEWKKTRINAINEEYNARIEAIQKELNLLDKSEEEKTRAEEDAEYERKKLRLEQLAEYEHDATTKANYEQELIKLQQEYQKTLDNRALKDKKEALKAQQDVLKTEQTNKLSEVEQEATKQKEMYQTQLDDLDGYYSKQIEMAQETAEKMLLNVDTNQKQILDLLKKYGNDYEITGQSLGEKLAQGINEGIAGKIQNIVQKIQDSIDTAINNKIASWAGNVYKYEAGSNKPVQTGNSINIQQYNTIQQTPEMPSETYRKLNNISQKLAEEFAGM